MKEKPWTNQYRVWQSVEIQVSSAGPWVRGIIVRKTATGIPIVETAGGCFAADTKASIRSSAPQP